MQIIKVDPRSLKENPDDARRSTSSPQSDALLLATVKAVGIIQPPVIPPELDGGNGYVRMAAEGAVAAYEQVIGETWKPFNRPAENPGASLDHKAAAAQMDALG